MHQMSKRQRGQTRQVCAFQKTMVLSVPQLRVCRITRGVYSGSPIVVRTGTEAPRSYSPAPPASSDPDPVAALEEP